jgi:type VI secretion system secreted protein Hcp
MAFNAYMTFKGQKQGKLIGNSKKASNSEKLAIIEFKFGLETPFEGGSGQPKGARKHKPIVIVREVDEASPLLWQALCTNESFEFAELSFARPGGGGKSGPVQIVRLTNGIIRSITHSPNSGGKRREQITLEYDNLLVNGMSDVAVHTA